MRYLISYFLLLLSFGTQAQDFNPLIDAVYDLQNGDTLVMEYQMNGCFNPYQKGTLRITQLSDTIHANISSSNERSTDILHQNRIMAKPDFIAMMEDAHEVDAENIFGSTIVYTLNKNNTLIASEAASIQKRHFIQSFYPFSSFVKDF